MGTSVLCPVANIDDLDNHLESVLSKSLTFKESDARTVLRSISFDDGRSLKPAKTKTVGSSRMTRGSLSFNGRELNGVSSLKRSSTNEYHMPARPLGSPLPERETYGPELPLAKPLTARDLAAVKLQKTYKSFRTRRQLADCAVVAEKRWWKLLDFAKLEWSSVSFFDVEKPESAVSRWSRARTRAAKVGKGLSKNAKARKLTLEHWLEAIDPRHRYGHNLQFYFAEWRRCQSRQHFFYWLDVGEGKDVNLERCPRSKLQEQCIMYLGPTEREAYEVTVEDGKFRYKLSKEVIDTTGGPDDAKWIFVLSVSMVLYIGLKQKGKFQHSSFLAGGATLSAGRLVVIDGVLKAVSPHSGHYHPTEENFDAFVSFLEQHHIDHHAVKKSRDDGDDDMGFRMQSGVSESNRYGNHLTLPRDLRSKITTLEIPKREGIISAFVRKASEPETEPNPDSSDYDTAEESLSDIEVTGSKRSLFDYGEEDEAYDEPIPQEKIVQRINSHKETKSFQLAKQLSCRWTTGAGPRIGCIRDYPLELQARAMEDVCLSPKSTSASPRRFGYTNDMHREASSPCSAKKKMEKSPLFSDH